MAAQTPDTAPTAEAQLEPTSAEVPREVTDDAPAEETPADESAAGELADVTEGQAAEAPPVEAPSVGAPSAEDGFQVRSEFTWTKLEFAPLVWQYDREPQTVDIRDEADGSDAGDSAERSTVDVRDEAVHKSRRRKARR